ncbi:MAG: CHASE2 domain-containing protein [Leptolyngbya sp. UWPOB_LEPTO1]|uniref:CHASE2 domain-containing protein n=1 Tax=Leptolyngbya sp. UWPOB_LEPTO1 TaxID=2815653 RepID=UPI001ACE3A8A|nr:CHASE2 domain-containing protein [Leptolyngbya sp. UWPOB_LEPTO1]MBN8564227.1 CHASE2 domain-containing protein [Leptolyngbya sp. UWPOB_LEPTO1]
MRYLRKASVREVGNQLLLRRGILLPWMISAAIVIVARTSGVLQSFERQALDSLLHLRPAEPTDERVLIVGIDEEDIRRARTYPIPDRDLAKLIQTLKQKQPAVIGLDIFRDLPVPPGHADLVKTFRASSQNLVGIEKILGEQGDSTINPPPDLPPDQVGFVDAVLDPDGKLRRSLLGTHTNNGDYRFSLTIRLAERYLSTQKGISLDSGIRDSINMRFGSTELQHLSPNSGSYVGEDTGGNQILINFRSGSQPFRVVAMKEVLSGSVPSDWIRDRIVLIGIMSHSAGDIVYTNAIHNSSGLMFGVEAQAHATSQIVSAVIDGRSLISAWADEWEYLWIVGWTVIGIALGWWLRLSLRLLAGLILAGVLLVGVSYGLLILGWWVPVVPPLLVFLGTMIAFGFRYDRNLKDQISERQFIIERTYDEIHRGSLNVLARIQRNSQEKDTLDDSLKYELEELEDNLRSIYKFMQQQFLKSHEFKQQFLVQNVDVYLNQLWWDGLENPTSELLYQVFDETLQTDAPGFRKIRTTIENFKDFDDCPLTPKQKQALCLFLEGALQNVGKHAIEATELQILYKPSQGKHRFQIIDNGLKKEGAINISGTSDLSKSRGSRQAEGIARLLGGEFQLKPLEPHGMLCELTWSHKKPNLWFLRKLF